MCFKSSKIRTSLCYHKNRWNNEKELEVQKYTHLLLGMKTMVWIFPISVKKMAHATKRHLGSQQTWGEKYRWIHFPAFTRVNFPFTNSLFLLIHLRSREWALPLARSPPACSQWPGRRSPEPGTQWGLLCGWPELNYLGVSLRVCNGRKVDSGTRVQYWASFFRIVPIQDPRLSSEK